MYTQPGREVNMLQTYIL